MKSITKLMVVAMVLVAALVVAPAVAAPRDVQSNGTIYVGEENLNLTGVFGTTGSGFTLEYAFGESNQKTIRVGNVSSFDLLAASVGSTTGRWQAFDSVGTPIGTSVLIEIPSSRLDVVLGTSTTSVDGKSVTRGQPISFRLINNLDGIPGGKMNVEVTTPGGGKVTMLGTTNLAGLNVTDKNSDTIDLATAEIGTYTAKGVLKDVDFTGAGFDTNTVTFEVASGSLAVTSNKDSVVRNNPFTVTITGESKAQYTVNVTGGDGANVPMIIDGQTAVKSGNATSATIETSASGTASIEFNTTKAEAKTYTIKVKGPVTSTAPQDDEVKVKVEAGSVTITTSGTGTYYVGEEITLSGTNTDSGTTYLFMTGPNLPSNGINLTTGREAVKDTDRNSFTHTEVKADDTWSYKWLTSDLGTIDSGGYTIYAVSSPQGRNNLTNTEYSTQTIQLRPGFITATLSSATVARGDDITITGIAQGNPTEVRIWIFGKNFYGDVGTGNLKAWPVTVESDGTFEFDDELNTKDLVAGQYFVVVQHPMGPNFEVSQGTGANINSIFRLDNNNANVFVADLTRLQAAEAANALIDALESPYVNDAYTKLTFFLEDAKILIDPIGDQSAGSTFTISGTTNLAAGEDLIVEVTSAAFQPGQTGEATGFSSDAGTVAIQAGETMNTWSFEVDGTSFRPDQYIVTVESIEAGTTTTGTFNVVEAVPTTQPSGNVTTAPTGTETTPTGTETTEPTPTTAPGFGAILALAGLGAVAFLVLRRD